jgi:hypothetical protein
MPDNRTDGVGWYMPWSFPKLKRELDRERLPGATRDAFFQRPQLGANNLLAFLAGKTPTANQAIHGLRLLQELKLRSDVNVDSQAVANVTATFLGHVDLRVRSAAASDLVCHCMHAMVYADFRLPVRMVKDFLIRAESHLPEERKALLDYVRSLLANKPEV